MSSLLKLFLLVGRISLLFGLQQSAVIHQATADFVSKVTLTVNRICEIVSNVFALVKAIVYDSVQCICTGQGDRI
jgi:hypothetical protein